MLHILTSYESPMETGMKCLFPPAQDFNALRPTILPDMIASQPCILGKQYSVTVVRVLPLKDTAA